MHKQMACQEIDVMRRQVCDSLRGNVNVWHWNLQARYGDPRVFAAQREQMQRQQAALEHDLSRRSSVQFQDTYAGETQKIKNAHTKRISGVIKSERATRPRGRKSSAKPPESEDPPAQTPPPQNAPSPAPVSASPPVRG